MTEPPREIVEVIITTDEVRLEVHRLGECLNPEDIAGPEWGPLGNHPQPRGHDDA